MIIHKVGSVTIPAEGPIKVENWEVSLEPSDPVDASPEQLLVNTAAKWALARLRDAVTGEVLNYLRNAKKEKEGVN